MSDDLNKISAKIQQNIELITATANAMAFQKQMKDLTAVRQDSVLRALQNWQRPVEERPHVSDQAPAEQLDRHFIPFPENPDFFPRDDVLPLLRARLDHDSKDNYQRSMLLWGIGGVGKTQLALAYAYERKHQGLKTILWISSETKDTILQSVTELSVKLKLEGAVEGGQHENNRGLLLEWLRNTRKSELNAVSLVLALERFACITNSRVAKDWTSSSSSITWKISVSSKTYGSIRSMDRFW
jgi:hypothetical protein